MNVKWCHSQGNFVLPGCMVDFMKKSPYYSPTGIVVGFMSCQAITRDLDHSGTSPRPYGMDVNCPLWHLCSVYQQPLFSLLTNISITSFVDNNSTVE